MATKKKSKVKSKRKPAPRTVKKKPAPAKKKTTAKPAPAKSKAAKKSAPAADKPRASPPNRSAPPPARRPAPPSPRSAGRSSGTMRRPGLAEQFQRPGSQGPSGLPRPELLATEDIENNRRRFRRVPKALKVRLFAGDSAMGFLEASLQSADMSLSGMFLQSTFFIPEDTPVRIEFDAPWGQVASARGVIARVQRDGPRPGFGIRFLGLNQQSLTDLVCIFVGDQIQAFVDAFCQAGKRSEREAATLWEGILAWEIDRLRRNLEDTSLIEG